MAVIAFLVAAILFLLNGLKVTAVDLNWPLFFTAVGLALMAAGYGTLDFFRRR